MGTISTGAGFLPSTVRIIPTWHKLSHWMLVSNELHGPICHQHSPRLGPPDPCLSYHPKVAPLSWPLRNKPCLTSFFMNFAAAINIAAVILQNCATQTDLTCLLLIQSGVVDTKSNSDQPWRCKLFAGQSRPQRVATKLHLWHIWHIWHIKS